ncbi:MAG TPA: cytochrome P450 [Gammaproteobacteria bacterium]|nr:cytochrome P450 [Gammaproteobacteria bacterium]
MKNAPTLYPPRLTGSRLMNTLKWFYQPYAHMDKALTQCGSSFFTDVPSLGRALVTGDPRLIKAVVSNDALIGGRGTRALRPLLGEDTLIILENERHRTRRKTLAPHFKHRAARLLDEFTLKMCGEVLARQQKKFTVQQFARDVALPVIVRLIFGEQTAPREQQAIEIVHALYGSFQNPLFLFLRVLHVNFFGLTPWGKLVKKRNTLNRFIDSEINIITENGAHSGSGLLGSLITDTEGNTALGRQAIYNEVISLLLFGHDTSAISIAWLFYHVYRDQAILDQLNHELAEADDLSHFCESTTTLLHACVKESLRLCPVVVHLTRIAVSDTQIAGIPLHEGQAVLPSAYLAHHNPALYPDPHIFEPKRFLLNKDTASNNPYAFFPFGLGARKCIGEELAMRQMKLILAKTIRDADLALLDTEARPCRQMLLIGPGKGTQMKLNHINLRQTHNHAA